MTRDAWEAAYVATSVALGEALDATLDSLGGEPPAPLLQALASSSREVRAHALARALSEVAQDLEELGLA